MESYRFADWLTSSPTLIEKCQMPFQVSWDSPEHDRILLEFSPPFTWNDFHEGIRAAHQWIGAVEQSVDLIIWAHVGMPSGFALP